MVRLKIAAALSVLVLAAFGLCGFQATSSGKSFGLPPCSLEAFTSFQGGTNGSTVTAATLNANTLGINIGTWALIGTIDWETAASMPLQNQSRLLCGSESSYPSGTDTMGVGETGTGSAVANSITYLWNDASFAQTYISVWFYSTLSATDTSNIDILRIGSNATDYSNIQFQGSGTTRNFKVENAVGGCTATGIAYTSSTWVNLQMTYIESGAPQLAVFNTSGTQIGSTATCTAGGAHYPESVNIGRLSAQTWTSGTVNYWDSLQIWLGPLPSGIAFPGLPQ